MNAAAILTGVAIAALAAAILLVIYAFRRRWVNLLLHSLVAFGLFLIFGVVVLTPDFEESLSNTGEAVLTGIAVAGAAELMNSLRVLMASRLKDWGR